MVEHHQLLYGPPDKLSVNDDSKALPMVPTVTAVKIHCLQAAGVQFSLLQSLIEVLLQAENSEQG